MLPADKAEKLGRMFSGSLPSSITGGDQHKSGSRGSLTDLVSVFGFPEAPLEPDFATQMSPRPNPSATGQPIPVPGSPRWSPADRNGN